LADIIVSDDEFSYAYLQGFGDGTFRSALNYYAAGNSFGIDIATGDFNGDSIPDFVMTSCCDNTVGITVFLSRSDGSLHPGVNYGSGGQYFDVAVGDFNGDGKTRSGRYQPQHLNVDIYMGVGDGTFTAGNSFPSDSTESNLLGITTGDFNHDGFLDLGGHERRPERCGHSARRRDGNFSAPTNYQPFSVAHQRCGG